VSIGLDDDLVYSLRSTEAVSLVATVALTVERRSVLLLDAAVPLLVGAVIVGAGLLHGGSTGQPLALALGLAAALTLAARRRAPGCTLAISGALVLVLFHIDAELAQIAVLAPAVALYSLALTRSRVQQLVAAAAAVTAVVVLDLIHTGNPTILQTLGHVALVAIPLLAAEALRTRRSYVALLIERLELAEQTREQEARRRMQEERMRIARELHDVVAHTLTTINVQAATAAELLPGHPAHARTALQTIEDASRNAIAELRAILGVLRDPDDLYAPRIPAPGVEGVAELVQGTHAEGLDVQLTVLGAPPGQLSDAVSLAAYRIVQESLTNARRHAGGAPVRVNVSFEPGELTITVENDAGTAGNGNGSTPRVGIIGMTERAAAVGGALRAAPLASGFRVDATLPYQSAGE